MRQEILNWHDVDRLLDTLVPQLRGQFEAMVMITRGGIVPGGLISEALDLRHILTAAVRFPSDVSIGTGKLMMWPEFLQFPDEHLLQGRRTLVVDDVWGSGRTITAVKSRVEAAGGYPESCVLHYNPSRTLFNKRGPNYYAATTDAHIVYPWEIQRPGGLEGVMQLEPAPEIN